MIIINYIKVDGKVQGAKCRNEINGEEFEIKAKCVINATGPFTDSIRLVSILYYVNLNILRFHNIIDFQK